MVSKISSGEVNSLYGVGKGISIIDGDGVGNTISGIDNDTGGSSGSVKGEDSLDGDIEVGDFESFEHNLGHLLSIFFGVQGSFG